MTSLSLTQAIHTYPEHKPVPTYASESENTDKTQAQQVSALKKQIEQENKSILRLVNKVAKNNLANKVQLLENVLNHIQQSADSLNQALISLAPEDELTGSRQSQDQFPGCPACS